MDGRSFGEIYGARSDEEDFALGEFIISLVGDAIVSPLC